MLTSVEYDDTIGFVLVSKNLTGLANSKRHKKRTGKMSTETQTNEQTAKDKLLNETQAKVDAINKDRGNAKGTRVRVGQTRGKGSQVITYEAFDESLPSTLPASIVEFMQLAKVQQNAEGEKLLISYLIDGFNSQSYTNASDPIAEYVDSDWTPEQGKAFKTVIKNFSSQTGYSIEDAVNMIKPKFVEGIKKAKS